MKWLIASGMFLQFISFWLAAPELMGDVRLKRLNTFLQQLLSNLSMILLTGLILVFSITMSINGILKGISASETGFARDEKMSYYINLAIAGVIYIFFMIKFRKIKQWLDRNLCIPLINKFTYSDSFRKNSLVIGAILFTFGFLIQFVIILMQP